MKILIKMNQMPSFFCGYSFGANKLFKTGGPGADKNESGADRPYLGQKTIYENEKLKFKENVKNFCRPQSSYLFLYHTARE